MTSEKISNPHKIGLWVQYNIAELPGWMTINGRRIGKNAVAMRIDKLIQGALASVGIEHRVTGHGSRISSNVFELDPEKVLSDAADPSGLQLGNLIEICEIALVAVRSCREVVSIETDLSDDHLDELLEELEQFMEE